QLRVNGFHHPSARVDADLISTTGVPSNASIGPAFTHVPSISRTVTGCKPTFRPWRGASSQICRLTFNTYVRIDLKFMARPSLRHKILRAGLPVMFRCGYHAASVRDICAAAGAPQGPFTNHFPSTEAFAAEVLDQYFEYLKSLVRYALDDESLTPRQRLQRYMEIITDKLERDRWMIGCLIGDFSLQASSHSKPLRKRLDAIFQEWRALFAGCIAAGQSAGEIESNFEATDLAEFLLASWEGAILRMKVERNP